MGASGKHVPVEKVTAFMDQVVIDCEQVQAKIIVLKSRMARKSISEASVMRELDEMLLLIRR